MRTGDHPETLADTTAGQGNLYQFRYSNAAGNPRNDSCFNIIGFGMIEFLVTTSEDKRVPPLEPDHVTVVDGKINDQMVNLILRVSMFTCTLADDDLFCTRRRKTKQDRKSTSLNSSH